MLQLCERFHKLPSEIYAEDREFGRMLAIEAMVAEARPGWRDLAPDEF